MVFLGFVLLTVLGMGTVLYVVEGPQNGFTSIRRAARQVIDGRARVVERKWNAPTCTVRSPDKEPP